MPGKGRRVTLWVAAVAISLVAALWQRYSGPTYPARPSFEFGGETYRARLVRSGTTGEDTPVVVPAPKGAESADLFWRRYPTGDPFLSLPMAKHPSGVFEGALPSQPPAGKVEYFVVLRGPGVEVRVPSPGSGAVIRVLRGPGEEARVPDAEAGTVILRYKGAVPLAVLLPHVLLMFLSLVLGARACLAALFAPGETGRLLLLTLAGMTLGGMILGPVVQKYAFGAFWTGFPYGYDLTDNKTLVMWLVWLVAGAAWLAGRRGRGRLRRAVVVAATVVMLAVYVVPHSLRGSQLDYDKLKDGSSPAEAIETGQPPR